MTRRRCLYLLAFWAYFSLVARADEIRLKDGSKIVGTIVGYEDDAFKVQTSYGFAMVRKTNIAEIIPSAPENPAKAKEGRKDDEVGAPKVATKPPATIPAPSGNKPAEPRAKPGPEQFAPGAAAVPSAPAILPSAAPPKNTQSRTAVGPEVGAVAIAPDTICGNNPAAPQSKPSSVPQETVAGNLYINKTYGFSMFKPPAWEILQDARLAMPEAITALGTSDRSTLLVIGCEVSSNSMPLSSSQLDDRAATTERKLQGIYENYRLLNSRHLTISGLAADEQRFRGSADGHDWSVVALTLSRGKDVFTILGMTYADSDLIQLEENVINRVLTSLQFTSSR